MYRRADSRSRSPEGLSSTLPTLFWRLLAITDLWRVPSVESGLINGKWESYGRIRVSISV